MAANGQADTLEQHDELVVAAAAREVGVSVTTMRRGIALGKVPARRVQRRGREGVLVIDRAELTDAIARHQCCEPGCPNPALGLSDGCRDHDKTARKQGLDVKCPGCGKTRYLSLSGMRWRRTDYCKECIYSSDLFRQIATANHVDREQARRSALDELRTSDDMLTTADLVGMSGLLPEAIYKDIRLGVLRPAGIFDDNHRHLFSASSTKPWLRDRALNASPSHQRWLDVGFTRSWLEARLLQRRLDAGDDPRQALAEIEKQAKAAVTRRRRINLYRSQGRPRADELHLRWDARIDEILAEMTADYEWRQSVKLRKPGERRPSRRQAAAQLLFEELFGEESNHRQDWPGYPTIESEFAAVRAAGVSRIVTALHRLHAPTS
jgi:hypothetical protein